MPEYYPAFLNLAGKRCVIIGGGMVAQGKIAALRDAGAQITLISPDATAGIQRAAQRGDVEWLSRKYQVGDLAGAFIAVAATNVWHVNREIFEEAEGLGVLLNVVDDPDLCTFIAPSIVKRKPVTLAISTGGASPALARKLRETLSESSALDWADATGVLSKARRMIKEKKISIDPQRWQCSMTQELLGLAKSGHEDEALEMLLDGLLGRYSSNDSNGMCSNISECVSGGCQRGSPKDAGSPRDSRTAGSAVDRGRLAQTAGD